MADYRYTHGPKLLALLRAIADEPLTPACELAQMLGVSRPTIKRLLATLRRDFGVDVEWEPEYNDVSYGRYRVRDWGVFNRRRVLEG